MLRVLYPRACIHMRRHYISRGFEKLVAQRRLGRSHKPVGIPCNCCMLPHTFCYGVASSSLDVRGIHWWRSRNLERNASVEDLVLIIRGSFLLVRKVCPCCPYILLTEAAFTFSSVCRTNNLSARRLTTCLI
jgi:hypothetical protein